MGNSYLLMGKIASVTAPIVFQRTMYLPINAGNHGLVEGHPNKNIVQNHLNIALLVVKRYTYAYISPLIIFRLFGFPCWKSSDPKIIGIKTLPFRKFQPEERLPKILGDPFKVKIR